MASTFTAKNAAQYEQMMGRWSTILARPFIAFAGLEDHEAVLDVGCGTGSLTYELVSAARDLRITAIDYSPVYLAAAQMKLGAERIAFAEADAANLPLQNAGFDRAFSLLVLQFVQQSAQAVAEMRRVVRPGGVVAACVWDMRGGYLMQRIFWDTAACLFPDAEAMRATSYGRPMTGPGELKAAFLAAGLFDVEETTLTIRMAYRDFDDLWAPIAAGEGPMGAYAASLADEPRAVLAAAFRRAYEAGSPDGKRSFAASAWACRGTVASK